MYICLCNALKDSEIARAIDDGATSAYDAFECFGCKPICGKCVPLIQNKIQNKEAVQSII